MNAASLSNPRSGMTAYLAPNLTSVLGGVGVKVTSKIYWNADKELEVLIKKNRSPGNIRDGYSVSKNSSGSSYASHVKLIRGFDKSVWPSFGRTYPTDIRCDALESCIVMTFAGIRMPKDREGTPHVVLEPVTIKQSEPEPWDGKERLAELVSAAKTFNRLIASPELRDQIKVRWDDEGRCLVVRRSIQEELV